MDENQIKKFQDFENTDEGKRLRELSEIQHPLNDSEFEEMMELKEKLDRVLE